MIGLILLQRVVLPLPLHSIEGALRFSFSLASQHGCEDEEPMLNAIIIVWHFMQKQREPRYAFRGMVAEQPAHRSGHLGPYGSSPSPGVTETGPGTRSATVRTASGSEHP
jgi:hypothetical protein